MPQETFKVPQIPMDSQQRAWLTRVHDKWVKGVAADDRRIRLELGKSIRPGFDPGSIDSRLLRHGEITLLGILQVMPTAALPYVMDRVIRTVRDLMLADPDRTEFPFEVIARAAACTPHEVRQSFRLMSSLGFFWNGLHDDRVNINRDESTQEYLAYQDLGTLLEHAAEELPTSMHSHKTKSSWPQFGAPSPPAAVTGLHGAIMKASGALISNQHLPEAAFAAMKMVHNRVRDYLRSLGKIQRLDGREREGQDLFRWAFSADAPVISLAIHGGPTGRVEQEGMMNLFVGAWGAIRNPGAHEHEGANPADASRFLQLASFLMERLDRAGVP